MNIVTAVNPFKPIYQTDAATSAFPSRVPTTTLPSNDGVIKIAPNTNFNQTSDNKIHFVFAGTGVNNATFQAQILVWTKVPGLNSQQRFSPATVTGFDLWIPEIIYNVDGILSQAVGVDNTYIDSAHRFADTLTVTAATSNTTSAEVISPANDTVAGLTITLPGPQMVEVLFKTTAAMNGLYRTY
jgi:hypothetical protein